MEDGATTKIFLEVAIQRMSRTRNPWNSHKYQTEVIKKLVYLHPDLLANPWKLELDRHGESVENPWT